LRSAFERELLDVVSVFDVVALVSLDDLPELFIVDEPLVSEFVPLAPMVLELPLAPMLLVLSLSFILVDWLPPAPVLVALPDGLVLLVFAAPFELDAAVPVPEVPDVPDVPCAMAYPPMASAAAAARVVSVCLVVIIETPSVETYRDGRWKKLAGSQLRQRLRLRPNGPTWVFPDPTCRTRPVTNCR
jgi:hypothetical protein